MGPVPHSPVTLERHALKVKAPVFMDEDDFDIAFDHLVRKGALWPCLGTTRGRAHCKAVGVDPFAGWRATVSDTPYEEAKEICVVRIRRGSADLDRLIAIAEHVVAQSLGLIP